MADEVTRHSVLESRHRALGSDLGEWNGMDVAWEYASNPEDEHDAVRTAAGLFDVSGLRKIFVRGPDALAVVDHVITRDMTRIGPGRSAYGPNLTEDGTICDDAIIFNLGADEYLVVHGSGQCMKRLQESAEGKDVTIEFDDDLHDISLQGPKSTSFLTAHTPADLENLGYFHQVKTELFGHPAIISRTGYSGERGYEIFSRAEHIADIWDQIVEKGAEVGIMPCSFTCLDKIRVEAGLLFYPYDMTEENTPWDVGLGWAVSKVSDYRGKEAAMASKGKEKIAVVTLDIDHGEALEGGEKLLIGGQEVGVVNSPVYSHRMGKSLALGHITLANSAANTSVQVEGDGVSTTAVIAETPIYDPQKSNTHS
ncbi:aminomethyltransferase family protein [Roseovarius sp. 2305UL8-3]|uniref:aminomethyltransferase family protein n=1 Tax=Roseovarius conchicola TaxID=3121636 RepID=UPI0035278328